MPELAELNYRVRHLAELRNGELNQIGTLVRQSVAIDYPERPRAHISRFEREAAKSRHNLNMAVGGALFGPNQRFARQRDILAYAPSAEGKEPHLLAYLAVADNVSSQRPGAAGQAEMAAKLWLPTGEAVAHRHRWFGQAAYGEEAREQFGEPVEDGAGAAATPLDVMMSLGLKRAHLDQPTSAYPWQGERLWRGQLRSASLHPAREEDGSREPPQEIYPFGGKDAEPAAGERQYQFTGPAVKDVRAALLTKPGVEAALAEI
jgi:hypothetical protein